MAEQGLWNIGSFNLPDFGISEALGIGPQNSAVVNPNPGLDYSKVGDTQPYQDYRSMPNEVAQVTPYAPNTGVTNYVPNTAKTATGDALKANITQQVVQDQVNDPMFGFDMKYYPGWGENEARADWLATGGSKGKNSTAPQKTPTQVFLENNPQSDIMEGQDPNQFLAEIENIYNEAMGLAGKKEGTVRGMAEANKADIEKQYGVGQQTLGTSKEQANRTLQESQISARQRQEQALDAARRLYDEMNRGYQQRFGGASSAGEGARALAGVEQQRQMGTTRQAYQDAARQIETQKLSVEENYKNQLLDLQAKRDSAVTQANNSLSSALLEIESDKASAGQEKALAKMNALKEYKDKLFNVKQQEQAFKQNLDLMREQANIQLQSAASQLASYGQTGANAYNQFAQGTTLSPQSGLRIGGNVTAANQLTGQISNNDELSRILAATGQMSAAPNYLQQSRNDVPAWLQ